MLQIYTYKVDNMIVSNDFDFDGDLVIKDIFLRDALEQVEDVKFCSDDKIVSKINGQPINVYEISTGAKTYLNILMHKDRVVNVQECGTNILQFI